MLAAIRTSTWPIGIGWRSASARRVATASASVSSATSSTRTANSSPPWRAAVSDGRRASADPPGGDREDLVAAGVAVGVVEDLEVVEIDEEDRDLPAGPPDCGSTACSTRSRKRTRLARPVSPSWSAWWRISSYSRAFSRAIAASPASIVGELDRAAGRTPPRRADVTSISPTVRPAATSGIIAIVRWPIDAR